MLSIKVIDAEKSKPGVDVVAWPVSSDESLDDVNAENLEGSVSGT